MREPVMRVFLILLMLTVGACTTPKTEKEKENKVNFTILKTIGCVMAPQIPVCIPMSK